MAEIIKTWPASVSARVAARIFGPMPAFSTYFFTLGRGEEDHNLIAACHSCNSIKHCRTPEDAGMVIKFREGKEVELYVLA